jgi:hypothetical protein
MKSTLISAAVMVASLLLHCETIAQSTIVHVDPNAVSPGNGTPASPYQSISSAIAAQPQFSSTVLLLASGTYNSAGPIAVLNRTVDIRPNLEFTSSGVQVIARPKLVAAQGDLFLLQGSRVSFSLKNVEVQVGPLATPLAHGFVTRLNNPTTSYDSPVRIELDGIDGHGKSMQCQFLPASIGTKAFQLSITDVDIGRGDVDVRLGSLATGAFQISRSRFAKPSSVQGTAVYLESLNGATGPVDFEVDNCMFENWSGAGVWIKTGPSQVNVVRGVVTNCVFHQCATGLRAEGNGLGLPSTPGLPAFPFPLTLSIFSSCAADTTVLSGAMVGVSSSIPSSVAAQFVDAAQGDFHLRRGSPAIGIAPGIQGQVPEDFDGNPINDGAPDAGIDEFLNGSIYLTPRAPKLGGTARVRGPGDGTPGLPWLLFVSFDAVPGSLPYQSPAQQLIANPAFVASGAADQLGAIDYALTMPSGIPAWLGRDLRWQMAYLDLQTFGLYYSPNEIVFQARD